MALKMIRRRGRSARAKLRSLRQHVHRAGYVRQDLCSAAQDYQFLAFPSLFQVISIHWPIADSIFFAFTR